jgi:hypothetical protein
MAVPMFRFDDDAATEQAGEQNDGAEAGGVAEAHVNSRRLSLKALGGLSRSDAGDFMARGAMFGDEM